MADTVEYVLHADGLPEAERAQVVRDVVDLLADQADTYETDIPLGSYDRWPPVAQQAADHLVCASGRQPDTAGTYAGTGLLHRQDGDEHTWAAFTTFAGYAYDATVWDAHGRVIATLADEGTSAVLRLTAAQAQRAAVLAAPGELTSLATWRTRQREVRRAARRRRWTGLWRHHRG